MQTPAFDADSVELLLFDVFGTVVDWHGSIVREVLRRWPEVDGDALAIAWRSGYQPAMARVMAGEIGWMLLDDLHRMILDDILPRFGLGDLGETERADLNRIWHRLDPWPDSVAAITRLKRRYIVSPLSNGNIGLLTEMAKRAGLPWDCVLSAEVFRAYKPDPATYLGAAGIFDLAPGRVLMVATHPEDLAAAHACGLRTAYIERPYEYGPRWPKEAPPHTENDLHAADLGALAEKLLSPPPAGTRR